MQRGRYIQEILKQVEEHFRDNTNSTLGLQNMKDEVDLQIQNVLGQVEGFKENVMAELEKNGIKTGLDTGFKTLINKIGAGLRARLDKILFRKNNREVKEQKALPPPQNSASFEKRREEFKEEVGEKAQSPENSEASKPIETYEFTIEPVEKDPTLDL